MCNCWNDIMANSVTIIVLIADHLSLVFAPYLIIRYYHSVNMFESFLAVFIIQGTLPWTFMVLHLTADYNNKSADMLILLASRESGYLSKVYRSVGPYKAYFGGFVFIKINYLGILCHYT